MINRIAIAASAGALAGELAVLPLARALVPFFDEPAAAGAAAVLGLPVAIGLTFLAAGWLFRRPERVTIYQPQSVGRSDPLSM